MKQYSFTRKERLKKNSAINHVFDNGIPLKARLITVFLLKRITGSSINRAAFIPKKILYNKKTVLKNRFKRVLREAYRNTKHLLPCCHDIVILATNIKEDTSPTAIEKELADVFKGYSKK